MLRTTATLITLQFSIAGIGCASNVERHWGEAVEAHNQAMIANPLATMRSESVAIGDLDGSSASNASAKLRQHETSSTAQKSLPDIVIGAGRGR